MSVAIIGGADGPTAIYVSSSTRWDLIIAAVTAIAIGIAAFLIWKKRK